MSCDRTFRVSLLVDGEIAGDEAHDVLQHIRSCSSCRQSHESFLLLREQFAARAVSRKPEQEQQVLAAILRSRPQRPNANGSRGDSLVPLYGYLRERARLPKLRIATAAVAVVLFGFVLAIGGYLLSRRQPTPITTAKDSPTGSQNPVAPPSSSPRPDNEGSPVVDPHRNTPKLAEKKNISRKPRRLGNPRPRAEDAPAPDVAVATRPNPNDPRGSQPALATVISASAPAPGRTPLISTRSRSLDTARHAEQAQMLLRAFRNAKLTGPDLAHERARSEKLLYRNIVLRKEAATGRDPLLEQTLDRLEPILLDIANLPDNPAAEDVDSIKERMRKKNLVVLLQASAARR